MKNDLEGADTTEMKKRKEERYRQGRSLSGEEFQSTTKKRKARRAAIAEKISGKQRTSKLSAEHPDS